MGSAESTQPKSGFWAAGGWLQRLLGMLGSSLNALALEHLVFHLVRLPPMVANRQLSLFSREFSDHQYQSGEEPKFLHAVQRQYFASEPYSSEQEWQRLEAIWREKTEFQDTKTERSEALLSVKIENRCWHHSIISVSSI